MTQTNLECLLCLRKDFEESETIRTSCNHRFCLICLAKYVKKNLSCKIKCPHNKCDKNLSDFDIRQVLNDNLTVEYERLCMDKCKIFHCCLLPECGLRVAYTNKNIQYDCSNCSLFNCIMCGAAHKNLSCSEYRFNIAFSGTRAHQDELARAKELLDEKKRKSAAEAMKCDIIQNSDVFKCGICSSIIPKYWGVQLKNCSHFCCRDCLNQHTKTSTDVPVTCPYESCKGIIRDSECRKLLSPEEIRIYEDKSIRKALASAKGRFHCKSPNCRNTVLISGYDLPTWTCNSCQSVNCLKCEEIHDGKTCKGILSADALYIKEQIKKNNLMQCLNCETIIEKISGCNWIQCSSCKTELCWILQTYRWGPKGRGDTSAGCKCGVDGKRCHPKCTGCQPHFSWNPFS